MIRIRLYYALHVNLLTYFLPVRAQWSAAIIIVIKKLRMYQFYDDSATDLLFHDDRQGMHYPEEIHHETFRSSMYQGNWLRRVR